MFGGADAELARQLESLFHFGVDTLPFAEMHRQYEQNFGNSPVRWLHPLANGLMDELLRRIAASGQATAAVTGPASLPSGQLDFAIRPYLGQLRSNRVLREAWLNDLVQLSLVQDPHPAGLDALASVVPRATETPASNAISRWREGIHNDDNFAQFIATSRTPSTPWGFDLYLSVEQQADRAAQWALWEHNLSNGSPRTAVFRLGMPPSDASLEPSRMLILRGLVDALEIDRKASALAELQNQVSLVSEQAGPVLYNPPTAGPLKALSSVEFLPSFPYEAIEAGFVWSRAKATDTYITDSPRLQLQVLQRYNPSIRSEQILFLNLVSQALSASPPGEIGAVYRNVSQDLGATAASFPLLPWLRQAVPARSSDPLPAMLLNDIEAGLKLIV